MGAPHARFPGVSENPGVVGEIATRLVTHTSRMFNAWALDKEDRSALRAALQPVRLAIEADLEKLAHCFYDEQASSFAINLIMLDDALWTFVGNPLVEPTNNAAERVLRPIVIHRKTSYGTQTDHGSTVYETLQSIVQTLRHQHRDVYGWLRDTIAAHHHGQPLPAIIPV